MGVYPVLDGSIVALNFRDIPISGHHIDNCTQIGNITSHGFKFVICKNYSDLEASNAIDTHSHLEVFDHCAVFHVVKLTS